MLTSSFTGNLGNHMWIYAITRAVAEKNSYKYGFNPRTEYDYHNGNEQMDFMDIDYGETHNYGYNQTPPWVEHEWHELYEHIFHSNGDTVDFHPLQMEVYDIPDNTKLFIRCCQNALYLEHIKNEVKEWFRIKEDNKKQYESHLDNLKIDLSNQNICVINVRGGEYKGVPNLILNREYWNNGISAMLNKNKDMRFICVTDDIPYAKTILPNNVQFVHLSIGGDYYIVNNAKNILLSNSSFAIFPTWLNEKEPFVIAPFGWARYNVTTGYWASSDIYTFGTWNFMDREGDFVDCL